MPEYEALTDEQFKSMTPAERLFFCGLLTRYIDHYSRKIAALQKERRLHKTDMLDAQIASDTNARSGLKWVRGQIAVKLRNAANSRSTGRRQPK